MCSDISYYKILQVPSTASAVAVKEAYHAAARKHHPDKRQHRSFDSCSSSDDEAAAAAFLRIQKAWECLRDPETRKLYDEALRIQKVAKNSTRRNAVPIQPHECREVELPGPGGGEFVVVELIYQCRCGNDLHTSQLPAVQEDDESGNLVQCLGCSLVYDISSLYDEDDEEEQLSL